MLMLTVMAFIRVGIRVLTLLGRCMALRHDCGGYRRDDCPRAIQQFVEFTPVQPYATAARAIVDLDALSIGHDQRGFGAVRTFHVVLFRLIGQGVATEPGA